MIWERKNEIKKHNGLCPLLPLLPFLAINSESKASKVTNYKLFLPQNSRTWTKKVYFTIRTDDNNYMKKSNSIGMISWRGKESH